jgi:CO/xanthine dehydrogenase Mo-binding subunit
LPGRARAVGYEAFGAEQRALRPRGVHRGLGLAAYVEGTGIGPYEGAAVRLDASGKIVVATGAYSQGQGHQTVFGQIAADVLGVSPEEVSVIGGDAGEIAFGRGVRGGLSEEIPYGSAGQLLTGSLLDCALPRADELPAIETIHFG